MRATLLSLLLLGVTGCSGSCGDEPEVGAPSAAPKAAEPGPKAAAAVAAPLTPLVPTVSADAMQAFAPARLGAFAASSTPKMKVIDLPAGAHLIVLRRAYANGDATVQLEVMDTVQAPTTRTVFTKALTITRESNDAVMKPVEIQGHKAVAQWNKASGIARVGVLVADRFLVNASIKPADAAERAIELAGQLDLAGLSKLSAPAQ